MAKGIAGYLGRVLRVDSGKGRFLDSLPLCRFCMPDFQSPIEALNIITGWSFDIPEAMDAGRHVVNQFRAFNFRHGLTKEMGAPSANYGSTPMDRPAQGKSVMPQWTLGSGITTGEWVGIREPVGLCLRH